MLPIGLASIGAVLQKGGFDVSIIDLNVETSITLCALAHRIKGDKVDVVGIGAMTSSITSARSIARAVKEHTEVPIVVGGPHASAVKEETLRRMQEFDYLIFGEGEYTMLELCRSLVSGQGKLSEIRGLGYRVNGACVFTDPRPLIGDLNSLPFPAFDLCNYHKYSVPLYLRTKYPSAHLITSRGCPHRCTFCSAHTVAGYRFRPHSATRIIEQIEKLIHDYGTRFFLIYDDTFTISRKRVVDFCELILRKNIKIEWFCMARVDTIDSELIELMVKSGLKAINFGVESGDQNVLKRIKKGITIEQVRNAFKIVRHYRGLRIFSSFMIGLPGETIQAMRKTIAFAVELDPDMAFFFIFTPYPGTSIYKQGKGIDFDVSADWEGFSHVFKDSPLALKNKDFSEDQLKALLVEANRRFYLRPKFIFKSLRNIRSFREMLYRGQGLWQFLSQNKKVAAIRRRR